MTRLVFISHTGRMSAGTSHSLLKLIHYLRNKFEILVLMPEEGDLATILEDQGINYKVVGIRRKYIPFLMLLFSSWNADLIYANNFSIQAYFSLIAAKLVRKPVIWHIREIDVMKEKPDEPRVFRRMRWSLKFADAIIANSKATARAVEPLTPNKNIVVVDNGIALEEFDVDVNVAKEYIQRKLELPSNRVAILNVGRLCDSKNQKHAIEVAGLLCQKQKDVFFCFLGDFRDPEYVNDMKIRAQQLEVSEHIRFGGYQENASLFFRGSDILLHTAYSEPQGRVVLEAMASGIPVIAYDGGGVGEAIVDNQTGFLVPVGDIDGLVKAASRLVTNPDLRTSFGVAGHQRVKTAFTSEKTAREVQQVIDNVLRKGN